MKRLSYHCVINYTWAVLNHYSEFNGHPLSSPKLRRIFGKHHIALFFKPGNSERDRSQTTTHGSAVHLYLKVKGHSFQDSTTNVLSRKEQWLEGVVKELIFVRLQPFVHLQQSDK